MRKAYQTRAAYAPNASVMILHLCKAKRQDSYRYRLSLVTTVERYVLLERCVEGCCENTPWIWENIISDEKICFNIYSQVRKKAVQEVVIVGEKPQKPIYNAVYSIELSGKAAWNVPWPTYMFATVHEKMLWKTVRTSTKSADSCNTMPNGIPESSRLVALCCALSWRQYSYNQLPVTILVLRKKLELALVLCVLVSGAEK